MEDGCRYLIWTKRSLGKFPLRRKLNLSVKACLGDITIIENGSHVEAITENGKTAPSKSALIASVQLFRMSYTQC